MFKPHGATIRIWIDHVLCLRAKLTPNELGTRIDIDLLDQLDARVASTRALAMCLHDAAEDNLLKASILAFLERDGVKHGVPKPPPMDDRDPDDVAPF